MLEIMLDFPSLLMNMTVFVTVGTIGILIVPRSILQ